MESGFSGSVGGAEQVLQLKPNSSISIAYDALFGAHDDLLLLELDEKLIPNVLNQRVYLRGQPDEDVVLCTQSKTYAIKFVNTSNSVFLVHPSQQLPGSQDCQSHDVASVIKLAAGNMELVEAAPRLDKLKLLLLENPYKLDDASEMEIEGMEKDKSGLYTWDDLVNRVQASDDELRSGLDSLSALEIDGYWRLVDESYMEMILTMLLHNAVLSDWELDVLDEDVVLQALELDGFPSKVARHCLHVYGEKVHDDVERHVWRLNEKRVCVHFAKNVLRKGRRKVESFFEEWRNKVPEKMQMHARLDMLEGEVLTEKIGVETWVWAFSKSSLPSTPAERFSILFKERPTWDWKDLQPYIRDLSVPGLSSEGLLLKYTRRVQPRPDVEPVFCAR